MANNVKFKSPALPIPPAQYNQSLYQRTFSVLRLYFNQIDEHLRQDLGDTTINGDLTVTGGVTATTLTGTLQTAAQTNITSVGTLDGGSITSNFGNINVGGSTISNTGTFTLGSTNTYAPYSVINGGLTLNLGGGKTFDMVSTNTGAGDSPIIQSYRDSSSPADADTLGNIRYQGNNDADQKVTYAEVEAQADDVTDGTEDGAYKISRMVAGTSTVGFELNASGVDISTPLTVSTGPITINSNNTNADLVISNTEASSADASPIIELWRQHGADGGNDGDEIGEIQFYGMNDRGLSSGGPQKVQYATIYGEIVDSTAGTEDGRFVVETIQAGSTAQTLVIDNAGVQVKTAPLTITSTSTSADLVITNSENSSADASPIIELHRSQSAGADGEDLGKIEFYGSNDRGFSSGGPEKILYASVYTEIGDASDGSEDGNLRYSKVVAGSQQTGDLVTQPLNGGVQFPAQSAAPSSPANGQVYYDTDDHKLKLYANGAWVDLN